uniref:Uncharacterized protein n=1 Tax=Arundo donax TaxID=35708 RepID=A0A0A9NXW4_ARUDO
MNMERRLLKAARTNVASFARRMDSVSALFSSLSNHPTSLRSIAENIILLMRSVIFSPIIPK